MEKKESLSDPLTNFNKGLVNLEVEMYKYLRDNLRFVQVINADKVTTRLILQAPELAGLDEEVRRSINVESSLLGESIIKFNGAVPKFVKS